MAGIDKAEMAANYGWALSFLKSNPELWKLFNKAVDKSYSVNRFVAELRNTKWFRAHSDSWRKMAVLQKTDPQTYNQQTQQITAKVREMAGQFGAVMSPNILNQVVHNAQWFGWDDNQLRLTLANYVQQMGSGHYGGEAGKSEAELQQYAYNMGINVSSPTLKTWLQGIVGGTHTVDDFKGYIQGQAESLFPSLAKQLKGGMTVKDIADPYMQQMASTLELDPTEINVFTPEIKKALLGNPAPAGKNGETGGEPSSVPLWQFQQQLRQDPRWLQTQNAHQSMLDAGESVLKDFGLHF